MKGREYNLYQLISNSSFSPGSLGTVAKKKNLKEIKSFQEDSKEKTYVIRAYISDHIPLVGKPESILRSSIIKKIKLNESPLSIYLHLGGNNVVYYELVANKEKYLKYIQVNVKTVLPHNAFRLARSAINKILDVLTSAYKIPLVIKNLDLISKNGKYPIAHEIIIPYYKSLKIGPLGGIQKNTIFDPFQALLREAILTHSPYYRLLCAYKIHEGIPSMRTKLAILVKKLEIKEKMPKIPQVDISELANIGFKEEFINTIKNVDDLFSKFSEQRNLVSHFFLKGEDILLDLSNGESFMQFSESAFLLLKYAEEELSSLSGFFYKNLESNLSKGNILPLVEDKEKYIVKDT